MAFLNIADKTKRELVIDTLWTLLGNQFISSDSLPHRRWQVTTGSGMGLRASSAMLDAAYDHAVEATLLQDFTRYYRYQDDLLIIPTSRGHKVVCAEVDCGLQACQTGGRRRLAPQRGLSGFGAHNCEGLSHTSCSMHEAHAQRSTRRAIGPAAKSAWVAVCASAAHDASCILSQISFRCQEAYYGVVRLPRRQFRSVELTADGAHNSCTDYGHDYFFSLQTALATSSVALRELFGDPLVNRVWQELFGTSPPMIRIARANDLLPMVTRLKRLGAA